MMFCDEFQVEDMAQDAQPDSNIGQPATENLDSNQTHQGNDYSFLLGHYDSYSLD